MNNYETTYYNTALEIPDLVFSNLECEDTFYFSKDFLSAFEEANTSIEYRYICIKKDELISGLAIIQRMSVALDNATEQLPLSARIARSLQCYISDRKAQTMVCGNVFLSGNYGVFIKEGIDQRVIYRKIAKEMKILRTKQKAAVFFFKDFNKESLLLTSEVEKHQFLPFVVEPNMRLKIQKHWTDFESYKADLKSKYRVKVNKADKKSAVLTVKVFDADAIAAHSEKLKQLYCNITDRALFKTIDIEIETYRLLKLRFRESIFIQTYWYENEMIGFATAFKIGNRLDAHFIGINYEFNKELSIYPRILNDYVRLGIKLGLDEVNFGRTSSEIKSTLGAEPENLTCYVRHRRTAANLLFKPLVRQIKMTDYKQHKPFKNKIG